MHYDSPYLVLLPGYIFLGTGIGLAISQNTQVTLSEIDPRHAGTASGILNTVRQIGTALGIAIIGAVVAAQFNAALPKRLDQVANLPADSKTSIIALGKAAGITSTSTIVKSFPVPTAPISLAANPTAAAAYVSQASKTLNDTSTATDQATTDSIVLAIRVGALFVFLGGLLSLRIPNVRHPKEAPVAGH